MAQDEKKQEPTATAVVEHVDEKHDDVTLPTSPPPASETDGGRDKFPLSRLLDRIEGPEILRHEWHNIVGAFHEDLAEVRRDPRKGSEEITRAAALKRVEAYLAHEEVKA